MLRAIWLGSENGVLEDKMIGCGTSEANSGFYLRDIGFHSDKSLFQIILQI